MERLDFGVDGWSAYRLLRQAHGLFWMGTAIIFSTFILIAPTNHYTVLEACIGGGTVALIGLVASLCVGFPAAVMRQPLGVGVRLVLALALWFGGYVLFGWRTQGPPFLNRSSLVATFVFMLILFACWSAIVLLSRSAIRLHTEAVRAERAIADARSQRLARLRSQLAPHFICNALNSIAEKMDHEPAAAQRMTADLADLIRDAIRDAGDEGTVEEEVKRLQTYLAVEKARFEDSLELDLDIAEDALAAPCPPLLLLPLVENAVRHGARATEQPRFVRLELRRGPAGEVRVCVSNPGSLSEKGSRPRGGLGLENVRRRLAELYPGRHELCLEERDGTVFARLTLRAR